MTNWTPVERMRIDSSGGPGRKPRIAINVLLASTSFPATLGDWRGLFMRHLVDALGRRGDISIEVWAPLGEAGPGVKFEVTAGEAEWLAQLAQDGGIAHVLRRRGLHGVKASIELMSHLRNVYRRHAHADVLHINWLQNALPVPASPAPLLVTALGTDMQLLRLPGMRFLLRRTFRHRPVILCPNAEWMVPVLQKEFGDIAEVRFVPFGIDPRWYALQRRFEEHAAPQWLCVSRLTRGKLGPLFEWSAPFFEGGKAVLHLFGPMQEKLALPCWVKWHGPASPDQLRDTWFPQAHGLITLSRHAEGRPQVMLEALAAGLPIVASRLPAHDDLLREGNGGVLVDSPETTLDALEELADPAANRALGLRGRARMLADIGTWDDCAGRYVALYRHLQERATK